jgi:hypothetical protein
VKKTLTILLLMTVQINAYPYEDPIVTDRPGYTDTTHTARPGMYIVELGYQYAFNNDRVDQVTQTFPRMELRTGISSNIEMQLYWNGWNIDATQYQPTETTVADVSAGGKYRIHKSPKYNLTMFGSLTLPVGTNSSSSNSFDPTLGLLWDYSLSRPVSLYGEALATALKTDNKRVYEAQLTVAVSFSHTDRLSSFIEFYGSLPSEDKLDENAILNGAFLYLLTQDVQLDIDAGVGLNDASSNFVGFGLSFRF